MDCVKTLDGPNDGPAIECIVIKLVVLRKCAEDQYKTETINVVENSNITTRGKFSTYENSTKVVNVKLKSIETSVKKSCKLPEDDKELTVSE